MRTREEDRIYHMKWRAANPEKRKAVRRRFERKEQARKRRDALRDAMLRVLERCGIRMELTLGPVCRVADADSLAVDAATNGPCSGSGYDSGPVGASAAELSKPTK